MSWSAISSYLAIYGALLSTLLLCFRLIEFRRDRAKSRVHLVPVFEFLPGQDSGVPVLSVANATANGCRIYEVELVMERTVKEKENARRISHFCPISGAGVVAGFSDLKIDLNKAFESLVHALWKGPANTFYPDVRMWAIVRFEGGLEKGEAKSQVYTAAWLAWPDKPASGIHWLKPAQE